MRKQFVHVWRQVGMNPIALSQIGYRRMFPQRLHRDLRLQYCVDLTSRSGRHLPLRLLRRNGPESNYSTGPKSGVHFIQPPS
jgi:hypothetical protein